MNAGSLSICAPRAVGLRLVTGDNPISSNDFEEQGLVQGRRRVGDAGLRDRARSGVVLEVNANAGSLSLNPRQTCDG